MDLPPITLITSALIPLLGVLLKFQTDRQDPGAIRRMRRHAQLLEVLPEGAKPQMERLVAAEVEDYTRRQSRKTGRKLKGSALAALIFVGLMTGAILYLVGQWAALWPPAWAVFFVVAVFGLVFMGTGLTQLFTYPEEEKDPGPVPSAEQRNSHAGG